jgi:hypothetical protein
MPEVTRLLDAAAAWPEAVAGEPGQVKPERG